MAELVVISSLLATLAAARVAELVWHWIRFRGHG